MEDLLPIMESISGFLLLMGIRASSKIITVSTSFKFSDINLRVLAIWPGNHWIFKNNTSMYMIKMQKNKRDLKSLLLSHFRNFASSLLKL